MEKGVIKWFDNKKGFGFIAREGGGADVFVHFSCIDGDGFKTLEEGDRVEYEAAESDKGLKASKVIKLGPAAAA
jgi:CspA family cold shock protein